jgi:hypothetical protein
MNDQNEFVALLCFPCGQDAAQLIQQTSKMTTTFINYFTAKMAAGVVTRAPVSKKTSIDVINHFQHVPHPSCVAHVFPPCDFAVQQLKRLAPGIIEEIEKLRSAYLFVVITRSDGNLSFDDSDKKVQLLPMVQSIGSKAM